MRSRIKLLKICLLAAGAAAIALNAWPVAAARFTATILPREIVLSGRGAEHRLIVEAMLSDGLNQDVTAKAVFQSSDTRVATVSDGGVVRAVSDGAAVITAAVDGQTLAAAVSVTNAGAPSAWSFRNHVLPVLTKAGCNSGACHGAAAGKNGFKLTLRGYDPDLDYQVITRQAAGRRTNRIEPARSLMLLKPTGAIPHGGGKRFDTASLEYKVLAEWIAAGTPPPGEADPQIDRLELLPPSARLAPGGEQQLVVRAHFSDGHAEDVTRWVKYSSADDTVATVGEDGRVKMQGYGETAIAVWYLSRVSFARVGVPFPNKVTAGVFDRARRNNFIDELVLDKLRQLNVAPSDLCSDSEFIRRAYLDAAGILPPVSEVEAFLADARPDKRARLVDALLDRSEFVDYWAYKWSDLLLVSSRKLSAKNMRSFYNWIRESVEVNKPWDRFVHELTIASGNSQEYGPVNYFLIHKNTIDLAENYTKAFMGISLTCARCHNHPLEKWTQKEYYGFANLLSRVSFKNGTGPSEITVYSSPMGDINHPRLGKPLPPKPLDAEPMPVESTGERREYLAGWLTSSANTAFARTLVNRVWGNFFGRGLVHPVDDLRATNPASNEELMAALTKEFVAKRFNVKHLVRLIMNSATYQLSSQAGEENVSDDRYYSHYFVRRLPAEVILDAISQVTESPERFPGYPVGTRALQLPDTRVNSYFLAVFGRPDRLVTSAAERQQDPSLAQALHVINGQTLSRKLTAEGNSITRLMKLGLPDRAIVERFYLSAYSRYPTEEEQRRIGELLASEESRAAGAKDETRRQVLEDLLWAMLTSKEFLFNH